MTCEWKIRWTFDQDAQCDRELHIPADIPPEVMEADEAQHHAVILDYAFEGSRSELTWLAGDRREFTGTWPGPCTGKVPGCILHRGHHGRCAP